MKKLLQRLVVLVVFMNAININAQVWNADPNANTSWNRYFKLFQSDKCSGTVNASITTEDNVSGTTGKSWKIRSAKNVRRAELSRTTGTVASFTHKQGENYYYSWRWRIDRTDATTAINKEITVFQWKTENDPSIPNSDGSQNYPLNMEYSNGKLKLYYFKPCVINGKFRNWGDCTKVNSAGATVQAYPSDRRFTLKEISVAENTWVNIVLRIQRGQKESGTGAGKVQLWINGTLQSLNNPNASGTSKSIEARTDDAIVKLVNGSYVPQYTDNTVYPKWGVYNTASCDFDVTVWLNQLKAYDNYTSAVNNLKSTSGKFVSGKEVNTEISEADNFNKEVKLYPNPVANDSFNIKLEGIKKAEVIITDLVGKIVFSKITEEETITIDKGDKFVSGIYFVTIEDLELNKFHNSKLIVK